MTESKYNDCEGSFFTRPMHDWGMWEKTGDIVSTTHGGVMGFAQERRCKKCGKRETDRQWY